MASKAVVVDPSSQYHSWLSKLSASSEERQRHFQSWIRADGSTFYEPERMRYRLLVSKACVESHLVLMVQEMKHLESVVPLVDMDPVLDADQGWQLPPDVIGLPAPAKFLKQLYQMSAGSGEEKSKQEPYTGAVTVPALWDTHTQRIINNNVLDICLMLNSEFNQFSGDAAHIDLYPREKKHNIDEMLHHIQSKLTSNIYLCGFATSQRVYDESIDELFDSLRNLDTRLGQHTFLLGEREPTLADLELFSVLIRMETVYYPLMKCNRRHLWTFPNLIDFTRAMFQTDIIRKTVDLEETKRHYMLSFPSLNPSLVVSDGPSPDYLNKISTRPVPMC